MHIRQYGKSILQVPDTGMSQYWSILEHFWCTSIARKCDPYVLQNMLVLFKSLQYWNTKIVQYCPILVYQYLGLEVYFFRQYYIPSCTCFYVLCMDWRKYELNGWVSGFVLSSLVVSCLVVSCLVCVYQFLVFSFFCC